MKSTQSRRFSAGVAVLVFSLSMAATRSSAHVGSDALESRGILASTLPDYSYFTADVSASAPGRALAVYQHGFNVEFMDFEQAVMVAADGATTRRIGPAETSDAGSLLGDNQPMTLSPDGRFVAIGDHTSLSGEITLLAFDDAKTTDYSIPHAASVTPLGWSPDSQRLIVAASPQAFEPYSFVDPPQFSGDAWLLDTASGELTSLGLEGVSVAAFSPDDDEVALQRGRSVDIVGMDGSLVRSIDLPAKKELNGPNAWSPDGDLLALTNVDYNRCSGWEDDDFDEVAQDDCVEDSDALTFVHADGSRDVTPDPISTGIAGDGDVLGWLGPQEVLVLDNYVRLNDEDQSHFFVNAVRLDSNESRRLSSITEYNSYGVGSFQMASALVPDLHFVDNAGSINRGPWPLWASIPTSLGLALAVLTAIRVAPRLSPWRRRKMAAAPQRP